MDITSKLLKRLLEDKSWVTYYFVLIGQNLFPRLHNIKVQTKKKYAQTCIVGQFPFTQRPSHHEQPCILDVQLLQLLPSSKHFSSTECKHRKWITESIAQFFCCILYGITCFSLAIKQSQSGWSVLYIVSYPSARNILRKNQPKVLTVRPRLHTNMVLRELD